MNLEQIAKIFDGNGDIQIKIGSTYKDRRLKRLRVFVNIKRISSKLARNIRDFLEIGTVRRKYYKDTNSNNIIVSKIATYFVVHNQQERFLELIIPFLITKKEKAKEALQFIKENKKKFESKDIVK
jgi:hypothetical protein